MTSGVCPSAPRAISVLFVDDDADTLFAYGLLAKDEGMRAFTTDDGLSAITLAHASLPDVIVLDVGLRGRDGLNGYDVARRLRASAFTGKIPIIIVSGRDSVDDETEASDIGCEGRFVKPCSADVLFSLVKELAAAPKDEMPAGTARASNG